MAKIRFRALEELYTRTPIKSEQSEKLSDIFGVNVFDKKTMQKYLSKEAFKSVEKAIKQSKQIDRETASQVALGMKTWAIERNATHYTHWFHPLTDATAEKHDAFFDFTKDRTEGFENFEGALLVQQEPDASSLPSGGLRNTFEARGYTAWDSSSPAFILDETLCIPTVFVAYTGESLDYKTPLLKSTTELDKAAKEVCKYFNINPQKIITTLGCEQEYFLIDEALYHARPDLMLTERTLMGHASAKDQQLNDHYFSSIPERVSAYMKDFENEAFKLGIPIKTRHNEVAPNQFECAPLFEECNLAIDHNQLLMDVMKRVARKHKFRALFHEKPYKDINGSGKHCNWSLSTDDGKNLLSPGNQPGSNLLFIAFLVNTIKAVYDYSDLLLASIASYSNEHRLGGYEAPPAIISIFLGNHINKILDKIEDCISDNELREEIKQDLNLNISKIPQILLDNTDRNRTSPFAFTGNRFEFRAVGSSANCALPVMILNTIVANQLIDFKKDIDCLIEKNISKEDAIIRILRNYIIASKNIRFDGNGYSEEWKKEAQKRNLPYYKEIFKSLEIYKSEKTINLFKKTNILTERELLARYEVKAEIYIKKIQIEARVLGDLAINHIVPTAIKYQNILIENVLGLQKIHKEFDKTISDRYVIIEKMSNYIYKIETETKQMVAARKKVNVIKNLEEKLSGYALNVKPFLHSIRQNIDKLELIVDDEMWSLPKYREMLFAR